MATGIVSVMAAGCFQVVEVVATVGAAIVHSAVIALPARAECCLKCSEALGCFHSRSSSHFRHLPRKDSRFSGRLSMLAELDVVCISDFFVHIYCMETFCHILSWSSHSCCKQLVCAQQIWVLYPAVGDLPHYFDCGRVLCSAVGGGPWEYCWPRSKRRNQDTYLRAKLIWQVKHLNGFTFVSVHDGYSV